MAKSRNTPKDMFIREVRRLMKKRIQQFCAPLLSRTLEQATYFVYGEFNSLHNQGAAPGVCCRVTGRRGDPGEVPPPLDFPGSVIYFDHADSDRDIGEAYDALLNNLNAYVNTLGA